MARSLSFADFGDENEPTETFDDQIAALLLAIEGEPVPARLQELALELQKALTRRRMLEDAR